jgi:hypothetical protein
MPCKEQNKDFDEEIEESAERVPFLGEVIP